MKTPAVTRESDKFMLRLPDGVRDRIAEAAKANNRSMNAELVSRIDRSFATEAGGVSEELLATIGVLSIALQGYTASLDRDQLTEEKRKLVDTLALAAAQVFEKLP